MRFLENERCWKDGPGDAKGTVSYILDGRRKRAVVNKTEVVAVEVPDQPGGLCEILQVLDEASINVEYMYAFVERNAGNAVIIFRFDDIDNAIGTLQAKNVSILSGEMLYSL